jgi:hypothetical protein
LPKRVKYRDEEETMKLFGGKKGDEKLAQPGGPSDEGDFNDSPTETVSLSARPAAPVAATPQRAPEPEEPHPVYGINNAIELMRALPVDQNVELVVQVIKTTLESLRVRVADIIDDASRKQKEIESRVDNLRRAIADFEKEIDVRKEEIQRLEADHAETSNVKQRLELAEKAQKATQAQKAAGPMGSPAKSAKAGGGS